MSSAKTGHSMAGMTDFTRWYKGAVRSRVAAMDMVRSLRVMLYMSICMAYARPEYNFVKRLFRNSAAANLEPVRRGTAGR